ncbi:integrase [Labrys wisconsinensis]|uniref:Integrase n=1 Tax=Labrys wisconsinensis TaxID=425677 RepID=A0ABU0J927_9HYPH|nr:integrase [Labrys wisconsinensis]
MVIDKAGSKRWVFLFRHGGKLNEMGLGGLRSVSLARARELARGAREVLVDGLNPIEARRSQRSVPSFGEVADEFIASMSTSWRSRKHVGQWTTTLTEEAAALRPVPVNRITTQHVLAVLKPIWTAKPATAARLRGRIEQVLDAAKALGYRTGENPALWKGHLRNLLPAPQKLTRGHHQALPYPELPSFINLLQELRSVPALALEFTILTAARSGEVRGATWSEIDLEAGLWIVPAQRMKAGREHRIPLCDRAQAILRDMAGLRRTGAPAELVFASARGGRPLSDTTLSTLPKRLEVDATVHGFRSTFRDWCGEATNFPREVAEAALAHIVGDQTERAYRRGDALEKRRRLMDAWAAYCEGREGAAGVTVRPSGGAVEAHTRLA